MSFIKRRLALATFAAALVVPGLASAQERVFFGIATGGTGGTYYPLGGMLAQLLSNKVVLGGKKMSATAETSGASVGNAQLLAARRSRARSSPPTSSTRPSRAPGSSTASRSRTCARSARSIPSRCSSSRSRART
jgi:hypothetical protein